MSIRQYGDIQSVAVSYHAPHCFVLFSGKGRKKDGAILGRRGETIESYHDLLTDDLASVSQAQLEDQQQRRGLFFGSRVERLQHIQKWFADHLE